MSGRHWGHYAPLIAAIVSGLLALWKGLIWWSSHSLAVKASLIDSGLDACTSLINFWAIRTALRPADDCHRYGHDKAEALASLAQSLLMLGLGFYVGWQAVFSLLGHGAELNVTDSSLRMMAVSTVVSLGLVVMQTLAVKRLASLALKTDVVHYKTDVITNLGVLCALWCGNRYYLDETVAVGLALYMGINAWHIMMESGHILMDRELDESIRQDIRRIVLSHPCVKSLNHLRTRSSGHTQFIQLNIVLDASISLEEAHTIAHEIEWAICQDNSSMKRDVSIHQEPVSAI